MSNQRTTWSFQDSSLERSFLWSLATTALPVVSGFIVSWIVARWAGPSVIGTVSWVMSFATALLIIGKFGLDIAASRIASEYGVERPGSLRTLFKLAIRYRLLFTLSVAVTALALAPRIALFFGDATLTNPIRIGALIVFCASIYEFNEGFLVGLNRLKTVYQVRSIHLLTRVALAGTAVFLGLGATWILGAYSTAWILAIAVYAVLLHRYLPPRERVDETGALSRRLITMSAALAVSSASVTVYAHMDRLMLGYFSGVQEVGQYAVARNIAEVSLFPVFAMIMMLRPALAARFSSGDRDDCAQIIRHTLRYSLVSGVFFAAILGALGIPLVTLVFSEEFRYSGELMILFVGIIAFRSVGSIILPALVAAERTRFYAYLTAISAAMNFILNLVLIPYYHARGAIVATIVSYGFLLAMGLKDVFTTYGLRAGKQGLSLTIRTILAGALPSAGVWWIAGQSLLPWEVVFWVAVLSVLYVSLIIIFRVGSIDDIRHLVINLRKSRG